MPSGGTYHDDARGGLTAITDEGGGTVAACTVDVAGRVRVETREEECQAARRTATQASW
jgi:hypothetical protein